MSTKTTKPTKSLNRVMIDAKKDDFYAHPYTVEEQVSLNFFDPTANSNKFYIAEIHVSGAGKGFRFYACHGRVGAKGRALAEPFHSLIDAQKKYNAKVREKKRNGYVEIDIAVSTRGSDQGQKIVNQSAIQGVIDTKAVSKQASTLTSKVADLVKHIYEEANQAVSLSLTGSVKSDIRAPLGNLGINGINAGRNLLQRIANAIRIGDINSVRYGSIEYYKYIPRKLPSDIRDETTWILNTIQRITKEMETLDLYEDALRMLPVMGLSDLDTKYNALNCDIQFITDPTLLEYINHKITSTHAPNHSYRLRVVNAFEVNMKNAPQFDDRVGNVVKLFHGSRSANLVGILSSYLKLPHDVGSDVIKTGAMFGPGIYFASDCTKSANYAYGSWAGRPNKYKTAFLMIAEVAMGNVHKTQVPYNYRQPPTGYHSVMGQKGAHLINNEFIVYNPQQVRVRYLVEVEKY